MSTHAQKSVALAEKITAKAEDAVSALDREIAKWPDDFAAIMWEAVAVIATSRAQIRREKEQK